MEGMVSGLLMVGFFCSISLYTINPSLPALLVIFFGQAGKSLFEVVGTSMALVWHGACFYTLFLELSMLITGHAY